MKTRLVYEDTVDFPSDRTSDFNLVIIIMDPTAMLKSDTVYITRIYFLLLLKYK